MRRFIARVRGMLGLGAVSHGLGGTGQGIAPPEVPAMIMAYDGLATHCTITDDSATAFACEDGYGTMIAITPGFEP